MRAPRQQSQHAGSILRIARFAEDNVIDHNDRIRAQHALLRIALKNHQCLFPCQPFRAISWRFACKRSLVNVSGLHCKQNPGIAQRPFPPRQTQASETEASEFHTGELHLNGGTESQREPASGTSSRQVSAPQIIRLETGAVPASSREMTQQAKIAAALTRAGITTPEAWSAAGVPYPSSIEIEDRVANGSDNDENASSAPDLPDQLRSTPAFSVAPPVVLMKGANNDPFVISYRNQKELVRILTLKASALISAGVAGTALGVYLLMQ